MRPTLFLLEEIEKCASTSIRCRQIRQWMRDTYSCLCIPRNFPGLLRKDFILLTRAMKLISKSSGILFYTIRMSIIDQHFLSCEQFGTRILNDNQHCLHIALMAARSYRETRRNFNQIFARTTAFRNSLVPYIARVLSNGEMEKQKLLSSFVI